MASKSKIKKCEMEFEGRIIDLQRFAYDVFVFSALKFKVSENCIPIWDGEENNYVYSDFILVLSRVFLKYQIVQRKTSNRYFKTRHMAKNLDSFEKTATIARQVLDISIRNAQGCIFNEILLTLSVINELIIFLASEECNLYFTELARFWYQYVSPMKRKFEKAGGLAELYKRNNKPKYNSVDAFYDKFISEFSFPYSEVLESIEEKFHLESDKYYIQLTANLPENEKIKYYAAMSNTVWLDSVQTVATEHRFVSITPDDSNPNEASGIDLPTNPGLGIPQHEELLRNAGISIPSDTTLSQNLPGPSRQRPPRECRGSSNQKKKERKSSSLQSMEKHFRQLDLDSSKSKSSSRKDK